MLGCAIAIGRAPSLEGEWRLWAGGRGYAGDHTSQIGRVNAYNARSGEPVYTLTGGEGFGMPLLTLGDIDGDGDADLLIAGDRKSVRQLDEEGRYLPEWKERYVAVSGRTGAVCWEVMLSDPFWCVQLGLCPDFDQDGLRDVLVGQTRGQTGRMLALSARDGERLRDFEAPAGEEFYGIGMDFAASDPAARDDVIAVGYSSGRDEGPEARSGVALLAASDGRLLGRLELTDSERELTGRDVLLMPLPDGRSYALLVSVEWTRAEAEGSDYVLRYDLRP